MPRGRKSAARQYAAWEKADEFVDRHNNQESLVFAIVGRDLAAAAVPA